MSNKINEQVIDAVSQANGKVIATTIKLRDIKKGIVGHVEGSFVDELPNNDLKSMRLVLLNMLPDRELEVGKYYDLTMRFIIHDDGKAKFNHHPDAPDIYIASMGATIIEHTMETNNE